MLHGRVLISLKNGAVARNQVCMHDPLLVKACSFHNMACTPKKHMGKSVVTLCTRRLRISPQLLETTESIKSSIEDRQERSKKTPTLVSTVKKYIMKRRDYTKKFTENNTITAVQAMTEYVLSPSDLEGLRQIRVRSPYAADGGRLLVYFERDVEKRAVQVWGSKEELERERKRVKTREKATQRRNISALSEFFKRKKADSRTWAVLTNGPGRVVAYAAVANVMISVAKFGCFLTTGSASMLSETFHSLADTCNQLLLLWGVNESFKKPDEEHPYGFGNMRHIMSLISGVGIFCLGSGVSVYHGVQVLCHSSGHEEVASAMSFGILAAAAVIESASLAIAVKETRMNARRYELSFREYVQQSRDPSTNVVLLEDSAAVLGLGVASVALALSHFTGNSGWDAAGSIVIGGILGAVATFLVTTNVNALIGRSIPRSRLTQLQEELEDDAVVRGVYDVKATQLSADEVKFKAEIDFDGLEVTRAYLSAVDLEQVLREIHAVQRMEDLEELMLHHGEQVIDTLGSQVDRLESELKKKNPDLRHIDLEVL